MMRMMRRACSPWGVRRCRPRRAGGPAEEAGAPAAAINMHASDGAVSSEPAVSSGVGATGDPVVSSAPVVSKALEAGHCAAVSGGGEAATDA